jgi:hypothetical protein
MNISLSRRLVAEFLGTAFLVAAVVGSGIMGERLANGNVALALLANTIATGAALVALIATFGPISGAHLNPAVSLADAMEGAALVGGSNLYLGSDYRWNRRGSDSACYVRVPVGLRLAPQSNRGCSSV